MRYLFCLFLVLSTPFWAYGAPQPSATKMVLIDQAAMKQVLDDYLAEQSNLLPHIELRCKSVVLPQSYRVPVGQVRHQVIPAKPGVIGSRRMTLMTRVDGQIKSNKTIRVELEALAEIAVAAGTLRRGTIIGSENIEFNYQDVSRLGETIFSLDEVVGKRLKRSIRLGQPLQRKLVEFPPVIKRGERVVIQARSTGFVLTAAGEAKQDGRIGESILVINITSRKEVVCEVVGPGLVKVEF